MCGGGHRGDSDVNQLEREEQEEQEHGWWMSGEEGERGKELDMAGGGASRQSEIGDAAAQMARRRCWRGQEGCRKVAGWADVAGATKRVRGGPEDACCRGG